MSDDHGHDNSEEAYLKLLRDEGFRLLAAFKRIPDTETRLIVIELAEALARRAPANGS